MNQRIIKFRAWDGHNIIKSDDWPNLSGFFGTRSSNEILMQFTGLKDKNGKEIYEGDVVRYSANKEEHISEVVYIESFFGVEKHTGILSSFYPIEIIGNIYENPELLKHE